MIRNSDIDRLRGLFAKRLIATMDMLKKTVGTVADLTVFRKLRELDYCTSYSHRGRFYTLRELAEFDENGLWWIRSVGFSSRGTLVATAEGLVNASEAGYAVEELDAIVRVGTKDVKSSLCPNVSVHSAVVDQTCARNIGTTLPPSIRCWGKGDLRAAT